MMRAVLVSLLLAATLTAQAVTSAPVERIAYLLMGQSNTWGLSHEGAKMLPISRDPSLIRSNVTYHVHDENPGHTPPAPSGPFTAVAKPLAILGSRLGAHHAEHVEVHQMAVSGSSLFPYGSSTPYWFGPTNPTFNLLDRHAATLASIGAAATEVRIVWGQGETDAAATGITAALYEQAMTLFVPQVLTLLGHGSVDVFIVSLGDIPMALAPSVAAGMEAVRDAQRALHDAPNEFRIVAHHYDLENNAGDAFHLTFESRCALGGRIADGIIDPNRFFDVVGVVVSGNDIALTLTHPIAESFANERLFEIRVGDFDRNLEIVAVSGTAITLRILGDPLGDEPAQVRHVHGTGHEEVPLAWHVDPIRSTSGEPLAPFRITF